MVPVTVQREAVHHEPKSNYAYALDEERIQLRLRCKKGDLDDCTVIVADKFDWPSRETVSMELVRSDAQFDYWQTTVKPEYKRLVYAFQLTAGDEVLWLTEWGFESATENDLPTAGKDRSLHYFEYPYLNAADVISPPEWVGDAVFYQIFPERFANGNPDLDPEGVEEWGGRPSQDSFYGGDLQGIIDNLDYLSELGITALYLTPIFASESNHKYNITDYEQVDQQFGDQETLSRLVDAAHNRGMRVVLDAVFNHCGRHFEPFQDVIEHGRDSEYVDWFHINSFPIQFEPRPSYDTFGFESYMPKLNTENPEVKSYLIETAINWIEQTGIDGWRLDVADEVDHQFWREFRQAIKSVKPEAYIVGEVWHDARPWLQGDQFDAVMNYPFLYAVDGFLGEESIDGETFANKINRFLIRYADQTNEVLFNLLGSHDIARMRHRYDGSNRTVQIAMLLLLTSRGTPCLYYGDEIGMTGGDDPDCRRPMIWDDESQDGALHQNVSELIKLRADHRSLRRGSLTFCRERSGDDIVVYRRVDEGGEDAVTVAVNRGKTPVSISVKENETGALCFTTSSDVASTDSAESIDIAGLAGAVWE